MHDSIPIDIKIEVDLEIHIAKTPLLMLQTVNRLINTLKLRFNVRIQLIRCRRLCF